MPGDRVDQTPRGARRWPHSEPPAGSAPHELTELRWFADGPLPRQVRAWFNSAAAATEVRRDRYLLDQGADVGIKVRGGQTLELKVRNDVGPWIDLGGGLEGRPEEWRKWSPADDVVDVPRPARWTSVGKVVTKRRFSVAGAELPMAGEASGSGCDVEVTQVDVGSIQVWSFAFAVSGPTAHRGAALSASWRTLTASAAVPPALVRRLGVSMGYPQWLAGTHASAPDHQASLR